MADDIFYHFSDEEDGKDALLDRAFDRWERMGGGTDWMKCCPRWRAS